MTTARSTKLVALTASLTLGLLATVPAQSISLSRSYARNFGDSDAGAYVYATGHVAAARSTRYVSGSGGSGLSLAPHYETSLGASGSGKAYADVKFLGSARRAGEFRMNLSALAKLKTRPFGGGLINSTCSSSGSVYLRVGNTVLWNSAFSTTFAGRATVRYQIMTPTLVVPVGAGLALLSGRAYGRVRAEMNGTFDPCRARVQMDGEAAVSGDASASVTVISLLMFASTNAVFYVNEQEINASFLKGEPGINANTTWGRAGSLIFYRGAMRGYIDIDAYLPPFIPVSTRIVDWSAGVAGQRLL